MSGIKDMISLNPASRGRVELHKKFDPDKKQGPPGFTPMVSPPQTGNRPKGRKYPSKARTALGG